MSTWFTVVSAICAAAGQFARLLSTLPTDATCCVYSGGDTSGCVALPIASNAESVRAFVITIAGRYAENGIGEEQETNQLDP